MTKLKQKQNSITAYHELMSIKLDMQYEMVIHLTLPLLLLFLMWLPLLQQVMAVAAAFVAYMSENYDIEKQKQRIRGGDV